MYAGIIRRFSCQYDSSLFNNAFENINLSSDPRSEDSNILNIKLENARLQGSGSQAHKKVQTRCQRSDHHRLSIIINYIHKRL